MKILVLVDSFMPRAGGSRVYYYNLYRHLAENTEDRFIVLTSRIPGWREFDQLHSNYQLTIIRKHSPNMDLKFWRLPKVVWPLWDAARTVKRERIDLIHAGDLFPPGVISLALKRALDVPYLVFCHGEEITQSDKYRYQPRVRNRIYERATGLVAASEFARSNLLRIGVPETKITKITPGVDCDRFAPRTPAPEFVRRYGLQGKTVLLTVARLMSRKGHDAVLQAVARLLPDYPNLRYLIVGRGPEEQRLRQMTATLGLENIVSFEGWVQEDQLPDFYNACDLFVMPNREETDGDIEGFGMVFLEANACGKAVIGGRSGGTAESILHGVTGYRVDSQDVRDLSTHLRELLANPVLRERFGIAGLQRARAECSWKKRAQRLREASQAVLQQSRAPSGRGLAPAGRD